MAVKVLTVGGSQGEREFRAEVEIISRVHHRHLVTLLGYCIAFDQRLLVYEFVENGTVEAALHDPERVMDWPMRMRVALGAARGLAYLHEDCHPRIFHRDIKSSNILLDSKYEAQLADFGLAKLASDTLSHVHTRVMGTFGYLAPEYAMTGKLTASSDAFSFGVVLLELLTARRPLDPTGQRPTLLDWARPLLAQQQLGALLDPRLPPPAGTEAARIATAASLCIRHVASRRPNMGLVVRLLEGGAELADLEAGLVSGSSVGAGSEVDTGSDTGSEAPFGGTQDFDLAQYSADMRQRYQMQHSKEESLIDMEPVAEHSTVSTQPPLSASMSMASDASGEFLYSGPLKNSGEVPPGMPRPPSRPGFMPRMAPSKGPENLWARGTRKGPVHEFSGELEDGRGTQYSERLNEGR